MKRRSPEVQAGLKKVHIAYADDWSYTVTLDGKPHHVPEPPAPINPRDPRDIARLIALEMDQTVHVVALNPQGGHFTDLVMPVPFQTPPEPTEPAAHADNAAAGRGRLPFGVIGSGFVPGEEVAFAVVVSTAPADADGVTEVPLPPALLTRLPPTIVLFGRRSGTVVVHDPAARDHGAGVVP